MRIDERYPLGELAQRVEAARRSPVGQAAKFDAYEIENVRAILESCVDFQPQIPETDRRQLIWRALGETAKRGVVDAGALRESLQNAEIEYLRHDLTDFVLATSWTLSYSADLTHRTVHGSRITFSRRLPSRFDRFGIARAVERVVSIDRPDRLTSVRVRVTARTRNAAADSGLQRLDLLRGYWNLAINHTAMMRHRLGEPLAVNQILPGPIRTLHKPSGALATETFWYELSSQQTSRVFRPGGKWERMLKWERTIRKRVQSLGYAEDIETLIIRYTRALDSVDYEVAFNKLWAVLEHLVGAVGRYEDLVNRTAFLYRERDYPYAKAVLEHLRAVRNGIVHYDESRAAIETYLYQLKSFVEELFVFHLFDRQRFASLAAAGEFLDLPRDVGLLRDRARLYRRAMRFLSPR